MLGHPVHLILVHFPSALFPVDWLLCVMGMVTGTTSFYPAAFYVLAVGVVSGWFTILAGVADAVRLQANERLFKKAIVHGAINATIVMIYSVLVFRQMKLYHGLTAPSWYLLAFKFTLILALAFGNYLGAELVLRYGVGTIKDKHDTAA